MVTVSRLQVAPVKGLGVVERDAVEIGPDGVAEDRLLYLLAEDGSVATLRRHPALAAVTPHLDLVAGTLSLGIPGADPVTGILDDLGPSVTATLYGRERPGRVLEGDLGPALSAYAGAQLRLVLHDRPGLGWDEGPVTLVSQASMTAVAPGDDESRARRFRMLVELDGLPPYGEDGWVGHRLAVGSTVVTVTEPLGRCTVITRSPATGRPDWPGLKHLVSARGDTDLGVIADVTAPGTVRVGDPVEVLPQSVPPLRDASPRPS